MSDSIYYNELYKMAKSERVSKAINNGKSSGQYAQSGMLINVNNLINLLEASSQSTRHTAIRRAANNLLDRMGQNRWQIKAGPHAGGFGDKNRGKDNTMHITLFIYSSGNYHLRMDQKGHLFEITGPGIDDIPPWTPPGSEIKPRR
jgi:hypothetical protein